MPTSAPHPPRRPLKAARPPLAPGSGAADALGLITDACLAQIAGNAAGVMAGADPEYLHQMRVGLRRLRCALDLCAPLAPCPPRLKKELDWLATALGAARDWQVLAHATLPRLAPQLPGRQLQPLQRAAAGMAASQCALAQAALASARHAHLLLMLDQWRARARRRAGRRHPLRPFAHKLLRHAWARLLRRAAHSAKARQRHRIRIAAKRLRYATEFFGTLYRPGPVRRLLKKLARLQDLLGELNDAAVARALLRQLAREKPALAAGAAAARSALAAHAAASQPRLARLLRRLGRARAPFKP